jgi:hypothetical protein
MMMESLMATLTVGCGLVLVIMGLLLIVTGAMWLIQW